jgi:hypothetical protein
LNDSVLLVQTVPSGDVVTIPRAALLLVRYDGSVLDTVAVIRGSQARLRWFRECTMRAPQPFAERTFVAFSQADGFIVIAHSDTAADHKTPVVRVTKVNLAGDTLFTRDLPVRPQQFDAALVGPAIDRLVQDNRRNWSGAAPSVEEQKRLLRAALYTPKYLPAISGLLVATDGTILVRREDATDEVMWNVLNRADAREIAQLRAPANARALAAGGWFFIASGYNAAGYPELVRYRLLPN